ARALLVGAIEESRGNANPESLVEALQCATDQTSRATKQMEVRRQQCDAQQVANLGLALKQLATVVQHSRNLVHQGRQAMNPSVN
ncbi:MAG: hypothetical protein HY289_08195, partial [Planctomycetes bacterium]|nr:hypothetical protein [Planctomycetota bacterium]